jgi:beta-glucosidase
MNSSQVEWEFGSGLSYTTFSYSNLAVSPSTFSESDQVTISVDVTNSGTLGANHSVLLFVFDMYRRVTPEYKLLKQYVLLRLELFGRF